MKRLGRCIAETGSRRTETGPLATAGENAGKTRFYHPAPPSSAKAFR